jgi:CRISPR-associated protein Cas5t
VTPVICLYLEAPFAAFRTFTAGWYRPTATFLTPSAAYGLALNVAGYDSRLREGDAGHDGRVPATLTRPGLPVVRVAVGAPAAGGETYPRVQTVYQQLHNYPVGASGAARAESARGSKYNITPVRREFLSGLRALVCLDGNPELEDRVRRGLRGELNGGRYGLPFLGDNQFLPDRLEEPARPCPAYWYERIVAASGAGPRPGTTRLTVWIDRADLSRTVSYLYAPTAEACAEVPPGAWTAIDPPAGAPPPTPRRKRPA